MQPDDHVCLCFRVSLRKINTYMNREDPPVASLISECLGAGTGCGWCVPYLKHLHKQHELGKAEPNIEGSAHDYQHGRARFRATGEREESGAEEHPGEPG
ncbi:MAG: bacterioferritin-associated ferredoxin [Phycisphaerales bacterium JB052]